MPKLKPQTLASRLFLIALFAFGLAQVPLSGWVWLWEQVTEMGKLIVLGK